MTTVSRNTAGRGGNDLASLLADGLDQLGLPLSAAQQAGLLEYQSMLAKWNGVYNLTAIRDPRQMMIQHVLDHHLTGIANGGQVIDAIPFGEHRLVLKQTGLLRSAQRQSQLIEAIGQKRCQVIAAPAGGVT